MELWKPIFAPLALGACALAGCDAGTEGSTEPWGGSLRDGLDQIGALTEEHAYDAALAVADRMVVPDGFARSRAWLDGMTRGASESVLAPVTRALDALGFDAISAEDRSEVEYARAIVLLRSAQPDPSDESPEAVEDAAGRLTRAVDALGRARAAGGPARLDAVYDLGTLDLLQAEALYMTIPEVSGGPPPPPSSQKDDASAKDDEDPLDVARRAYLAAREDFVERLTIEGDDDARANVELVLRRLRELDEIERQREEQQNQQDESQGDEQEPSDENKEKGDPSEDQDKKDPSEEESGEDDPQDPGEENQENPEESEDPAEEEPEPEDAEQPSEDEESAEPKEAEAPQEPEEVLMTDEERKRVMERNRAYQENGEQLRRLLRMRRKVPAKRDW